jgi:uncharacterized protein YutE (UPF0331/DUF86 family)
MKRRDSCFAAWCNQFMYHEGTIGYFYVLPLTLKNGGDTIKQMIYCVSNSLLLDMNQHDAYDSVKVVSHQHSEVSLKFKVVEAVIDIGKMLVSQKALREPGSNREVFLVLQENDLFPAELLPLIDKMIGMRNILVHSYDRIDDEIVYGVLQRNLNQVRVIVESLKKSSIGLLSL